MTDRTCRVGCPGCSQCDGEAAVSAQMASIVDRMLQAAASAPASSSPVEPQRITEKTTLGELAVQRIRLGVSALTLMRDIHGQLTAVVQSTSGLHIGQGATEASAIDAAFVSLRLAMLPAPLRALIE